MNYALWVVQALLALIFLWAGGMKLVLPLGSGVRHYNYIILGGDAPSFSSTPGRVGEK